MFRRNRLPPSSGYFSILTDAADSSEVCKFYHKTRRFIQNVHNTEIRHISHSTVCNIPYFECI